jgi:dTDP-4-amino-4,6-dideoxygalactose transaminase
MKVPLLDLKAQYRGLRDEIMPVIDEVCESQYFIGGPRVESFEKAVAAYSGTAHAVGVSSGTDALLASLMALDIGPGDAVLTTPYTFFATAGCIWRTGARPVFADIDPDTFNLDPESVAHVAEEIRRDGTLELKALLPVHLYGQCAPMAELLALADGLGLAVIEDAAQSIGSEYLLDGEVRRAGSMGTAGCFSFFPSKNLGGFGDGGMVVTNDEEVAERLRRLRNHGMEPKYFHAEVGGNFRLDALQAGVLEVKLAYLDRWHAARRAHAAYYESAFAGSSVCTPPAIYANSGLTNHHIYNQYVVRVPDRDRVRQELLDSGIGCEIYYPLPMHMQSCFESLGYAEGDFPVSEAAARETLALPVYPEMTEEMLSAVAGAVLDIVG